jgi:hypothetical protein
VLLAWGVAQWQGRIYRTGLAILGVSLFAVAALTPSCVLYPAFRTPYRSEGIPASANEVGHATFAGTSGSGLVSLQAYEVVSSVRKDGGLTPEGVVRLTLYWVAEVAPDELLTVWAQLGGVDPEARIAEDTRWLGGTLYPSSHWRSGDVVAHEISLEIPEWAAAPSLYWIRVGVQNEEGQTLALTGAGSDYVMLGPWRMRAVSPKVASSAEAVDVVLGEAIRLSGYELTLDRETVELCLTWRAEAVPGADYTVFAHLVGEGGALLAQQDGPPAGSAYPTSWWLPGDLIQDCRTLTLPEVSWSEALLYVGMYDASSGERLPAVDGSAGRLPDDAILLTSLER